MSNKKNLTLKETFDLALKNHQKNNIKEAQNLYNKILAIDPNYVDAHNNLGAIFKELRENQKAISCFEKAIAINPNYADAHNNLGIIFKELGENQKTISCFEKAIAINPNYTDAYYNLGIIFKELSENHKAKECYEKAIKIDPNYVNALNNLGIIFKELDENQKAKECYEKAIAINPNNSEALNNLGAIFKELGENQKAKECYEKAIAINPVTPEVYNNLANTFQEICKLDEAKVNYKKAIQLKPDFEQAHKNLDFVLKQEKLLFKIAQKSKVNGSDKNFVTRLSSSPFITYRGVGTELLKDVYKLNFKKLDTLRNKDARYGNGRCSDFEFFENDSAMIKTVEEDLISIMKQAVKSDIYIIESFLNIFGAGSGTVPHKHITGFDKINNLVNQKFSLAYYLSVGDQNCSEPGVFKLSDPDKEILPSEGMILIFPSDTMHSAVYNGKKDRVTIGVNFYSLL
jgi:tetratricopeptide (TPR) repeat protein